ncbi:MAG: molybdate ABC transporter substrate-binding protein [Cyanobacteria bacterium SBLK]|nr:molybdate ABC transporter substrate-binding protein [Cyanobacteria bacterium SBLK]
MKFARRYILGWGLGLGFALFFAACSNTASNTEPSNHSEQSATLTISAAASLQEAIAAVGQEYEAQFPNTELIFNFGSSGSLQHQIEQGAPADIFISAAQSKMEALRDKDLIIEDTHKDLLQNEIVAIAPKESKKITELQALTQEKFAKIALGDPESVPAGHYSKEVLDSANLYQKLANKFVFGKNVRQVLSYVETRNVDAGFVYATDAKSCKNCQIIFVASPENHSPIVYPIAAINGSKNLDSARQFLEFLATEPAKTIFEEYGFVAIANQS